MGYGQKNLTDFSAGDKIDLSSIDADPYQDGRQALVFVGKDYSGLPGEIYVEDFNGDLYVDIDKGDYDIDVWIQLTGPDFNLTAANFIL